MSAPRGWWRRNRWGLVALLPAILALVALSAQNVQEGVWSRTPREALPVDAGGSVTLKGVKIRLLDLAPAADLKTYSDDAFQPPPHVTIWRANLSFDGKPPQYFGCRTYVEDAAGRIFEENPAEASGARGATSFGCLVPTEVEDEGATSWQTTAYFGLPSDARPAAVRLIDDGELPRYVRLPAP